MIPAAQARILIVEDNFLITEMIAEACRDWGYEADGALDAISAVELMDDGAFDLLIVDYGLPGGVSGEEVLRHFRSTNPGGAALVISGMTLSAELPAGPVRFLQKPFTLPQLAGMMASLDDAVRLRAVA